jgi:hypothetical protein
VVSQEEVAGEGLGDSAPAQDGLLLAPDGWSRGGAQRLSRSAATVLCWRWLGQAPEVLLQTC